MSWEIEYFTDDNDRSPFADWLRRLPFEQKAAVIAGIEKQLAELGLDVCGTELGKNLGQGLCEFRIRHDEGVIRGKSGEAGARKTRKRILIRVFFHAYGDQVILLLGGYDKAKAPSKKKQSTEIDRARKNLKSFKAARQRKKLGERRRRG